MNKTILISLISILSLNLYSQDIGRLNIKFQIQRCLNAGVPVSGCWIYTDALGRQTYITTQQAIDSLLDHGLRDTIISYGGGTDDTNFFNTDLVSDGNHTHDQSEDNITINNIASFTLDGSAGLLDDYFRLNDGGMTFHSEDGAEQSDVTLSDQLFYGQLTDGGTLQTAWSLEQDGFIGSNALFQTRDFSTGAITQFNINSVGGFQLDADNGLGDNAQIIVSSGSEIRLTSSDSAYRFFIPPPYDNAQDTILTISSTGYLKRSLRDDTRFIPFLQEDSLCFALYDVVSGDTLSVECFAITGGGGFDSLITCQDSMIGFIIMGDTICISMDSIFIVEPCVYGISMGDTLAVCVPAGTPGLNVYNSNGSLTNTPGANRLIDMDTAAVRFRRGTSDRLVIERETSNQVVTIRGGATKPQLELVPLNAETGRTGIQFNGLTDGTHVRDYGLYVNPGGSGSFMMTDFTFADPYLQYFGIEDSLIIHKGVKFDGIVWDEDGDVGTTGDVLTKQVDGTVNWAAGGGTGENIYNTSDTLTDNRNVFIPDTDTLSFIVNDPADFGSEFRVISNDGAGMITARIGDSGDPYIEIGNETNEITTHAGVNIFGQIALPDYIGTSFAGANTDSILVVNATTGIVGKRNAALFGGDGLWTEGTDLIHVTSLRDSVGIGLTNPVSKLHVYSPVYCDEGCDNVMPLTTFESGAGSGISDYIVTGTSHGWTHTYKNDDGWFANHSLTGGLFSTSKTAGYNFPNSAYQFYHSFSPWDRDGVFDFSGGFRSGSVKELTNPTTSDTLDQSHFIVHVRGTGGTIVLPNLYSGGFGESDAREGTVYCISNLSAGSLTIKPDIEDRIDLLIAGASIVIPDSTTIWIIGNTCSSVGDTCHWSTVGLRLFSGGGGAGPIPINDLLAADGTNTIDNAAFLQEWQWNTLAGGSGLKLSSTSTAATGNNQTLLDVNLSGANVNNGQATYAAYFRNDHTGTGNANYGIYGAVSGGTTTGAGITGLAAEDQTGVVGSSTDGKGVWASSINTTGLRAETFDAGIAGEFYTAPASTNTVIPLIKVSRKTGGSGAAGIGASIDLYNESSTGTERISNQLISKLTTATDASRVSEFSITGVDNATTQTILTLGGNGRQTLNGYIAGSFAGASTDSVLVINKTTGVVSYRNAAAFGGDGTGFTQEEIQDFVGDMVTGNTENGIAVTYEDGDGTLDFVTTAPSAISPAQLTSDQDNYNPTDFSTANVVRISSDNGMRAITSMVAGTDWGTKKLINVGSYMIYFPMDHPDGTAANRFTGYAGDFYLFPGTSVDVLYDGTSDRWRVVDEFSLSGKRGVFYDWSAGITTASDWGYIIHLAINGGLNSALVSTTSLPNGWQLSTTTANNAGGFYYIPEGSVTHTAFASAHIYAESLVSMPVLSTAGETFTTELQIITTPASTSLEVNNTFGIRYSHGINGGDWELFSQDNAGSESVADLNVAVSVDVLYKLRLEVDKAKTECRAYINDVYVGRVTANLPNSVVCGSRVGIVKSAGTTARLFNVHSFETGAIYP